MNLSVDCIFYYVSDLDRAITFYTDAFGFKLHSRDFVARFYIGDVLFELVPTSDQSKLQGHGNGRFCLKVDDVRAAISEIRTKGIAVEDAEVKDNGLLGTLHDPDGNEICLWQYTK